MVAVVLIIIGMVLYLLWDHFNNNENQPTQARHEYVPVPYDPNWIVINGERYLRLPVALSTFEPVDIVMNTKMAKDTYKKFLTGFNVFEETYEVRRAMEAFAEALAGELEYRKEVLAECSECITEQKAEYAEELQQQKEWIADAKEEGEPIDKSELLPPFEKWVYKKHLDDFEQAKIALAAFKSDKRQFLVNYINEHHVMPS